jgi:PAS domain S-box-containing protein
MMAQMTEAVFLVRAADGVIVYANQGTGRMFGYDEDELIGKGFPALLAPSGRSAEETVAFIGSMLSRKGVWEGEMETITGDGRRFWCASSGSVFTHPSHGEVWMLLGRDITEKKRAEAELKEYQEHLEELVKERTEELAHANAQLTTVLDNLTEGLVVADLKGTLFHWNPAAVRMHGFASEEEGKRRLAEFGKLFELSTEKDGILPVEKWPLARILKGEELRNWEVNVRRLDRDWSRVFNYGGTVARNNDGTPVLAVVTVADITERKQAEEELKKALHEKEVLLKEIHHRVKNNMQVISSLVSLQAESFEDEAVREVLNDVTSRVRSMALVHDKLYQSGDLAKIDFAEYARSLLSSLWCAYGSSMATIRLTLDLSPIFFSVDTAVPCGLILNELAGNALKHAFRGRLEGQVTVSLKSSDDGKICLCVADDGVGLPVELDWRKARSLGLCLVQMLAKQIGATVEVNGSGAGTRFQIALPFPG